MVVGAILGALVNDHKGQSPMTGAVVGGIFGLIGVLILAVQPNRQSQPQATGWPQGQLWPCPRCRTYIPSISQWCPACGNRLVP